MLQLNCRAKGKVHKVEISADATVVTFLLKLQDATGIQAHRQNLKIGFPPKTLDVPADLGCATVSGLGIASREVIIIEEAPSALRPPVVATAESASAAATTESASGGDSKNADREDPGDSKGESSANSATQFDNKQPLKFPDSEEIDAERHIIPADNSCLFSSILFNLKSSSLRGPSGKPMTAADLRKICADAIIRDVHLYDELTLVEAQKPALEYAEWILKDSSWGGFMELSILAAYFRVQIVAVDVISSRMEYFPHEPGKEYNLYRMFVFFDGIHYDACKAGSQSLFKTSNEDVLNMVMAVAIDLKDAKHFTDTANFTLQCQHCMKLLVGEKDAQQHAKETGHFNFQEAAKA